MLLSPMTRCLETARMVLIELLVSHAGSPISSTPAQVFYGRWHEFSTLITPLAREFHPFSKMVGNEGSPPQELQERYSSGLRELLTAGGQW